MNSPWPGEQQLVFWREHLGTQSYVYVMHNPDEDEFKVGYSVDPFYRLGQLRAKYPGLRLRCVIPGPLKLEKLLHKRGEDARVFGDRGDEWFSTHGSGQVFLAFLEGLAQAVREAESPALPPLTDRSPEDAAELHSAIERELMNGWGLDLLAEKLDLTESELEYEAFRMERMGGFYCFFESADALDRKSLALRA